MSIISRATTAINRVNPWAAKYRFGGSQYMDMQIPPTWGANDYLQAYGNIGWLFRGASVIADSVARTKWHLYKVPNGDATKKQEITSHIMLDVMKQVNPFWTWYELIYLQALYYVLVGETFLAFDLNKYKVPQYVWPLLPSRMNIVREQSSQYISYYEYMMGGGERMRLEIPEVLHIKNSNPANPMRGIGAGNALSTDLRIDTFSGKYQEKVYHNDGMPGVVIEVGGEIPSEIERKQIEREYHESHAGWRNARKTAFAWGGAKVHTIAMSNKDLDQWRTTEARGQKILNVLGVPDVIAGKEGSYNKATAEIAKRIFAENTILPILTHIQEAFTEQWLTLYQQKSGIELAIDFDNPVPEDMEEKAKLANDGFKSGRISRNEARVMVGEEEIAGYDVFCVPNNVTLVEVDKKLRPIEPIEEEEPEQQEEEEEEAPEDEGAADGKGKALVSKLRTEEDRAAYWKRWVAKTEKSEKPLQEALGNLFSAQESVSLLRFAETHSVDGIYNAKQSKIEIESIFQRYLPDILENAIADAEYLVSPNIARSAPEYVVDEDAVEWLKTRMDWAAAETAEETAEELRKAIEVGFRAGESMDDIATRIRQVYTHASESRALRIARTEIMTASNVGAEQGYKNIGIKYKRWYAALDERICEICNGLHDKVYRIGTGERPPAHVNCRCVLLPEIEV